MDVRRQLRFDEKNDENASDRRRPTKDVMIVALKVIAKVGVSPQVGCCRLQ
jgi:hypothetical protein